MAAAVPEPHATHRAHGSEFRAFVLPPEQCTTLLVAALKEEAYLGCPPAARIVRVAFASVGVSDRGGEPRQARVCETLQAQARRGAGAPTVVVWRCFGEGLAASAAGQDGGVEAADWAQYRQAGPLGLQQAYQTVSHAAIERYNEQHAAPGAGGRAEQGPGQGQGQELESAVQRECWPALAPLVPPSLPLPCAYYDAAFLSHTDADRLLASMVADVQWAIGGQAAKRYTAVYCDAGLGQYAGGLGYANDVMHPWTPALRELRDRVAAWHKQRTGREVVFNVALLNRYDDGSQSLGYHADREEMDPGLNAPRPSPIASVSLGCERRFGFRRCQLPAKQRHQHKVQQRVSATKAARTAARAPRPEPEPEPEAIPPGYEYRCDFRGPCETQQPEEEPVDEASMAAAAAAEMGEGGRRCEMRLGHGSLLCMENACQFLYRHSLLPERSLSAADGPRVNITFRSKTVTQPIPHFSATTSGVALRVRVLTRGRQPAAPGADAADAAREVFVGRMPGVDQRPRGFKDTMFTPFESPFVDDAPQVAAARYRRWLQAQPAFLRWVCETLRGRVLTTTEDPWDRAHAEGLARIVQCADGLL